MKASHRPTRAPHRGRARSQGGSFLLEALVGILIFAFGILGLVGLQATAIRHTNDAQYRSEAVYLANAAAGRMWTMDRTQIAANYAGDKGAGGSGYMAFIEEVARLPGVTIAGNEPTIVVEDGPSGTSSQVTITVRWQMPGEATPHQYVTMVMVGQNT